MENKGKSKIKSTEEESQPFHHSKMKDMYALMLTRQKKRKAQQNQQITLIIYDKGTLFGDQEILDDISGIENFVNQKQKKKRQYSVQCMSDQGMCFKISNFKFRKLASNHRQILSHLLESKNIMENWIEDRIGQIMNSKTQVTSVSHQILQNAHQHKKNNKWQQQQDEVKALLIQQHESATKYLQETLTQLQDRIKREEKERHQKVFQMAKELSKLRENRHQMLHTQLVEKKKKELQLQEQTKLENQTRQRGSPNLTLDESGSQSPIHSPTPKNRITNSQLSKFPENSGNISPSKTNSNLQMVNPIKVYDENYLVPNYNQTTKSLKREETSNQSQIMSASSNSFSKLKNGKELLPNNESILSLTSSKKVINRRPSSPHKNLKHQFQEGSIIGQIQEDKQQSGDMSNQNKENKRVIKFLKRELEREQFPQFFIKSSIPLEEASSKTQQNTQFSNTFISNQSQGDSSIDKYHSTQSTLAKPPVKIKGRSLHENSNVENATHLLQEFLVSNNNTSKNTLGNKTNSLRQLNRGSINRSSNILKKITQLPERQQYLPLQIQTERKSSYSFKKDHPIIHQSPSVQYLAASQQIMFSEMYSVVQKDNRTKDRGKKRSITNYEQLTKPNDQENKRQSLLTQASEISKLEITFMKEKSESYFTKLEPGKLKLQTLPLKYFAPQYKLPQKQHRGIMNYNSPPKPVDTEQLKIVSPKLVAS